MVSHTLPSAVVLVLDRLRPHFLGPYGNTWVGTPAFNRLAAESALVEFALAESPELPAAYRSYLYGIHAAAEDNSASESLPQLLERSGGGSSTLLTDERQVAELAQSSGFTRVLLVDTPDAVRAKSEHETQLAYLMAAALDVLPEMTPPYLLWVHSRGMAGPWDAPQQLRTRYAAEDDPLPDEFLEPPEAGFKGEVDPDQLLTLAHAYAAQVAVADMCLGFLLNATAALEQQEPLLVVTSPRGYPLGEHGQVGGTRSLYSELVQIPLLLRFPDRSSAGKRYQRLVQTADVGATLREWFRLPASAWGISLLSDPASADMPQPVSLGVQGEAEQALLTPAWYLRKPQDGASELYVKPDDRWEVNEVSDRTREVVEAMEEALANFMQAAAQGDRSQLAALPEQLVQPRS